MLACIKEWIEERSKYVELLLVNVTLSPANVLITRPADPSNLYSDSFMDRFAIFFSSGKYGLFAFFLILVIALIVIVYLLYHKYKKPTEMEGDEHDLRKYNGTFFQRLKMGIFGNRNESIKDFFHGVSIKLKKLFSSTKNYFYKKTHSVD